MLCYSILLDVMLRYIMVYYIIHAGGQPSRQASRQLCRLMGSPARWLAGSLPGQLARWPAGPLARWLAGSSLASWLAGSAAWLSASMVPRLACSLALMLPGSLVSGNVHRELWTLSL